EPDTYRKLALSYDKLKETRLGFRTLAYSMINFRVAFNETYMLLAMSSRNKEKPEIGIPSNIRVMLYIRCFT
ncbi:hypothetical protein JT359_20540, partial [Candidatus Poribacteria bacterium]|nr:hypothetical protein [Candidatus Poribacteria bacterium]